YRGCFGLDFLLDQDSGTLYLGELNPRLTGATPLTSQAALERGLPPLVLYHLAEWLRIDVPVDVQEFNAAWLGPRASAGWGQMILCHRGPAPAVVAVAPRSGIWRLAEDGSVSFVRPRVVAPGGRGRVGGALPPHLRHRPRPFFGRLLRAPRHP